MAMHLLRPAPGRSLSLVGLVFAAVLVLAGLVFGAAPASAEPGDEVDIEFSADGVTWGGSGLIPWDKTTQPVPDGPPNTTTFYIRAAQGVPVDSEVFLGNWSVSEGSAWFQVDVNDVEGERTTLYTNGDVGPGVLMNTFSLKAGEAAKIALKIGIPGEETAQSALITPNWSIQFVEADPTVVEPDPGQGSLDLGSLGIGSLGSTGSQGSVGSTGSAGSEAHPGSSDSLGSSVENLPTGSNLGSGFWFEFETIGAPTVTSSP